MNKKLSIAAVIAVAAAVGAYGWQQWRNAQASEGMVSGNGRIEATEVDVATKYAGRVAEMLVHEGDFVNAGQVLARMQIDTLQAQQQEAVASRDRAVHAVTSARADTALRESQYTANLATVSQREAELDAALRRVKRSETLAKEGASSVQELDDDRARARGAEAALKAAQAQATAAKAAIDAAKAQTIGAESAVDAATATVKRIEADVKDSELTAPRDGRVQYRLAQPGEVVGAGGKVLNMVDVSDVYISFFLPEAVAGRVALGTEVRIVLDAAPQYVIPAQVSFVSSTAQFTPKTVETASERQKLMFRVKARISPELLKQYLTQVKTGLPGVAWIKTDEQRDWPTSLQLRTQAAATSSGS
ncbi:HlyD family efflux transporter periplasmic adaptor subunit [Comamonas testosteroni]|uniref:HlyD family efflux transporter periplasmic adaptor subunit n=1 Tax=Comamonas testosteroni TaxID=285 RepID=A0A373FKJ5_COMTE|nr:HlyD family efflux transporter periplasmic adaptor subunit [Comamonas testosteroni]RGE44684.1 HlyD family efflux transporter periplasmic adaptor subunit [Comamonas testosteroni]